MVTHAAANTTHRPHRPLLARLGALQMCLNQHKDSKSLIYTLIS